MSAYRWRRLRPFSRRRALGVGVSLAGAAALAAACGGDSKNAGSGAPASGSPPTIGAGATTTAAPAATQPKRGGVTRAAGAQVYDTVDPHRASGDPTSRLFNQVQSKLVMFKDPDQGELEPDVAQSYESPDATVYTFRLRQGVKWHNKPPANGRELVADDVKWHMERQADAKLKDGSPSADFRRSSTYKPIARIESPDKYTVKVTLDKPSGGFLYQLAAFAATIPNREATERHEAEHRVLTEEAVIGTGPFVLTQYRAGKDVVLRRNPDFYRGGEPLVDGQIWSTLFEDPNAQRAAFEQKQLDHFGSPDPSITKAVLDATRGGAFEVVRGAANTVFLHLNPNKGFKDIRLVQAMNMAIDRRQLIQSFHQGLGQVSGPVPWLQEGYAIPQGELVTMPGYRTDRELEKREARALWQAGGGPALGEVDVKVPRTWSARWPDTSQIIARMFNDSLGVTQFKSTSTDYVEEIIPNLSNGNYPNWFGWTNLVGSPDPRELLRNTYLTGSPANYTKVSNPQLDTLIQEALAIADLRQSVAKVREIQKVLIDNAQYGAITLYNYIAREAYWGYIPNGTGIDGNGLIKTPGSSGQAALAYNIYSGHLAGRLGWINTSDPSYQGRPPATA